MISSSRWAPSVSRPASVLLPPKVSAFKWAASISKPAAASHGLLLHTGTLHLWDCCCCAVASDGLLLLTGTLPLYCDAAASHGILFRNVTLYLWTGCYRLWSSPPLNGHPRSPSLLHCRLWWSPTPDGHHPSPGLPFLHCWLPSSSLLLGPPLLHCCLQRSLLDRHPPSPRLQLLHCCCFWRSSSDWHPPSLGLLLLCCSLCWPSLLNRHRPSPATPPPILQPLCISQPHNTHPHPPASNVIHLLMGTFSLQAYSCYSACNILLLWKGSLHLQVRHCCSAASKGLLLSTSTAAAFSSLPLHPQAYRCCTIACTFSTRWEPTVSATLLHPSVPSSWWTLCIPGPAAVALLALTVSFSGGAPFIPEPAMGSPGSVSIQRPSFQILERRNKTMLYMRCFIYIYILYFSFHFILLQ